MISRLIDGDIIISLDDEVNLKSDNAPIHKLSKAAFHAMVYNSVLPSDKVKGLDKAGNVAMHSSAGTFSPGVRAHSLMSVIPPDNSSTLPLAIVLHTRDLEINRLIGEAAKRWAFSPKKGILVEDESELGAEVKKTSIKLVPQTMFASSRRCDGPDDKKRQLELYRAFRAYKRNHEGQPLSKNQGASCSNFASYVVKVGIIDRLFPTGISERLKNRINEIEGGKSFKKGTTIDSEGGIETKKISKLSQLDTQNPDIFLNFEKLIREELALETKETKEDKTASIIPPLVNRDQYIEFLLSPLKEQTITNLCRNITNYPDIFELAGYVFMMADDYLTEAHCEIINKLLPGENSESLEKARLLTPGLLDESKIYTLLQLLQRGNLLKESIPLITTLLDQIITPSYINHENYLKLTRANDLPQYPYLVGKNTLDTHIEKAHSVELVRELPRKML